MDLRSRIAAWVEFTDSIAEGYNYFNDEYINADRRDTQEYIRWDKLIKDKYKIGHEYYKVADRILELVLTNYEREYERKTSEV